MLNSARLMVLILASLLIAPIARAEIKVDNGVCVICSSPARVYDCHYDHLLVTNAGPDAQISQLKGLQFSCIREIAQYGGHEQCAAERRPIKSCGGTPYRLRQAPPLVPHSIANEGDSGRPQTEELQQSNPNSDQLQSDQPKTLVDATKKSFQDTKKAVKNITGKTQDTVTETGKTAGKNIKNFVDKTNDNIKGAAKSTWRCLSSFFSDCK